jgi:hypothetical protein
LRRWWRSEEPDFNRLLVSGIVIGVKRISPGSTAHLLFELVEISFPEGRLLGPRNRPIKLGFHDRLMEPALAVWDELRLQ